MKDSIFQRFSWLIRQSEIHIQLVSSHYSTSDLNAESPQPLKRIEILEVANVFLQGVFLLVPPQKVWNTLVQLLLHTYILTHHFQCLKIYDGVYSVSCSWEILGVSEGESWSLRA